jgi:hypothetical protein
MQSRHQTPMRDAMRALGDALEQQRAMSRPPAALFLPDRAVLDAIADALEAEPPEPAVDAAASTDPVPDDDSRPTPSVEEATSPLSRDELCDELVERISRPDYGSIKGLAEHYAPNLIRLRLMRKDPQPSTALRAFQRLLRSHVYPRIPEDLLPSHIAAGRKSGGLRRPPSHRT